MPGAVVSSRVQLLRLRLVFRGSIRTLRPGFSISPVCSGHSGGVSDHRKTEVLPFEPDDHMFLEFDSSIGDVRKYLKVAVGILTSP